MIALRLVLMLALLGCSKPPQKLAPKAKPPTSENSKSQDGASSNKLPEPATPITMRPFEAEILNVKVTNADGNPPQKGDALKVTYFVENSGSIDGEVEIKATLSSLRFKDWEKVPVASVKQKIPAGATKDITIDIPVFLENGGNKKRYALGRGEYQLHADMEGGGRKMARETKFAIAKGKGVLTLVLWDKRYFEHPGTKGADPLKYVTEAMARKSSVFYPGKNQTKQYPGGLDEILGIKHLVNGNGDLNSDDDGSDVFDKPEALASKYLGLAKAWEHGSGPNDDKHGYDYFIALDKDDFGGVAFGAAQVSGAGIAGDRSKDRVQILLVHESGHVFGAPHCDPQQGYVMCSGEKNDAYKRGEFVWHEDSVKAMRNIFE